MTFFANWAFMVRANLPVQTLFLFSLSENYRIFYLAWHYTFARFIWNNRKCHFSHDFIKGYEESSCSNLLFSFLFQVRQLKNFQCQQINPNIKRRKILQIFDSLKLWLQKCKKSTFTFTLNNFDTKAIKEGPYLKISVRLTLFNVWIVGIQSQVILETAFSAVQIYNLTYYFNLRVCLSFRNSMVHFQYCF